MSVNLTHILASARYQKNNRQTMQRQELRLSMEALLQAIAE